MGGRADGGAVLLLVQRGLLMLDGLVRRAARERPPARQLARRAITRWSIDMIPLHDSFFPPGMTLLNQHFANFRIFDNVDNMF